MAAKMAAIFIENDYALKMLLNMFLFGFWTQIVSDEIK